MRMPSALFRVPTIALLLALPLAGQTVDTYQIDPVHSTVGFKIRHLVAKVTGHFGTFQGKIKVDTQDISRSSVEVTIDAKTINTAVDARDNHLRGKDFFNVATYPSITFKSTSVKEVAKGKLEVTGAFTMHGVTRTITIPITNLGTSNGMKPGDVVAGFEGALKLNRSDYGMGYMVPMLGDDVEISLDVEANKVH
jgi:polyisoprenoid-binding protein YceI